MKSEMPEKTFYLLFAGRMYSLVSMGASVKEPAKPEPNSELVSMGLVEEILEALIQKHPDENALLRAQYEIRHLNTYLVPYDRGIDKEPKV